MWAKILGLVVVAIGLGSVGAYYAHNDDAGCPLSAGGSPTDGCPSTGGCPSGGCPSVAPAPSCCEDEQQTTTVTGGAVSPKCPLCEGK